MRLVEFRDPENNIVYINPDRVDYLYESDEDTLAVFGTDEAIILKCNIDNAAKRLARSGEEKI